ncbi:MULTISPECIES: sensor histidine kinase [Rahnella]|jgi:two-component system LytT family sensor kinase|uniref:sensor histidine kinase n=1 Tax=Rahnella TaxID=34037 RepID=UPI001265F5A7|nr:MULTISPECIES: sensor histidine kinase [Rahnella]KAB8311229.1 sensor histidine kinase [Rouxiella chamberiensis]MBU9822602.1 sensor histidine kinase [Rahnella sp. BCC 1045]MCS3423327.1 two-component system LytT family sensor kinase [Rahnella sp. BIGb0603]MDF1894431.1 sensor histidine kinase [Rahnella contaminans]
MPHMFDMLLAVFDRAALMLICLFFLTRTPLFRKLLHKENDNHTALELAAVTAIFSLFAIFGTLSGINVEGSLINVRTIAIMSGGILFGPWVGIITGVISGTHRFLIDIHGPTSIPCLITSITAGFLSGYINKKVKKALHWKVGILAGMLCETLTMILILLMARPFSLGLDIVMNIAAPLILGASSIGLIVILVQSVEDEKEVIAARQARLALDIANKTLPYFRNINAESLDSICRIIRDDIDADAVAITDTRNILAYVGTGAEEYNIGHEALSEITKATLESGQITVKNNDEMHRTPQIHSLIIIPLWEKGEVTGSLKIYYCDPHRITYSLKVMAIGLSQIMSTQMEVSRTEQLREMANKAEMRALQSKINPHFLFNALNAISSSIRARPDVARQLIINLSRYLRYNLELNDELIDLRKELHQVQDYIAIEQARFGSKLTVIYDIDDDISVKIPSLLIQPLVENAIVHGIQKCSGKGVVVISVKHQPDGVKVSVKDTGHGINQETIDRVERNEMPGNKIGLLNVHHRVSLLYGRGLTIRRLEPGTDISFLITKASSAVANALESKIA